MNHKYISYSNLLLKFIDPLIDGSEDEEEVLQKAKMGMIAWNFHHAASDFVENKDTKAVGGMQACCGMSILQAG